MTPEEYQQALDAGYTPEQLSALGIDPPSGSSNSSSPSSPGGSAYEKPPGVSDWAWSQYLQAQKDYDEVWNDSKANPMGMTDPNLNARYSAAEALLRAAKAAIAAEVAAFKKPNAANSWDTGSTSSPFLTRQKPDGTLEQIPNPNYVAPRGPQLAPRYPEEAEYGQLRNEKLSRELAGTLEPSDWDKAKLLYERQKAEETATYTRGQAEAKDAYGRTQDDLERQRLAQTLEMQRRDAATKAWSEMLNTRMKAASSALIPGQQYFLGYEPGGAAERVAKMWGNSYNPETYRVPVVDYNEEDAWQQAWNRMGGR